MIKAIYENLYRDYTEEVLKEEEEFLLLFKKIIGKPRWIQRFWIRRILNRESFSLVSPTGVGKTTFGLITSLFFLKRNKKSFVIVPTTLLLLQCVENLRNFLKKLGMEDKINGEGREVVVFYHGRLKREERERVKKIIKEGNYNILLTTTQFLTKNFNLISDKVFDFIFVDDVDSVLKRSRNVDKILTLMGFKRRGKEWYGSTNSILVVSTATAKKGKSTLLFRKLLNFDVGSSFSTLRNIEDVLVSNNGIETIEKILKLMGDGGIIYARSLEDVEKYYNLLKGKFKIGIITSTKKKDYERFKNGELDYLIGTTYYYGLLVRGLDIPQRIKYTVFIGAPVVKTIYENLTPKMVKMIFLSAKRYRELKKYPKTPEELKNLIKEGEIKDDLEDIVLTDDGVIFPDIRTYIQASGRASRLTLKGITKGASFLIESDQRIARSFVKKAEYFDIVFKDIKDVDFVKLKEEIERSRREGGESDDIIKPTLFIVESPTKAKTIARFFGKPGIKIFNGSIVYEIPTERHILLITASLGHLVDLTVNKGFFGVEVKEDFTPIYSSIKRCRVCGYQFTKESKVCPRCGSKDIDDARTRIENLRRLAYETGNVIIGTDPDSEGEKISWDIKNLLGDSVNIKRAEFHEVTPKAIKEALMNLREIDENLVKAQIVRRIEDRWIGFSLSQKLWEVFKTKNLSAGRVQTPVLGWIIDGERKFKEKRPVTLIPELELEVDGKISDKPEIYVKVELIGEKEGSISPPPPYTTDEMLKDAARILRLPVKDTMKLAQDLFESGLITYHRTDSTYVSDRGIKIAKEFLGADFKGRKWGKVDAHECIRPTKPWDRYTLQKMIYSDVLYIEGITEKHLSLYKLIFNRFMASQCKDIVVKIKNYRIKFDSKILNDERIVSAEGRAFELFGNVKVKREIPIGEFKTSVKIVKKPLGYPLSQADVIRNMKEKGLGRPSTYSTIVEKLFLRKYIVERKSWLFSTNLGRKVWKFLTENFPDFVSEERTRILFEKMDRVERGEISFEDVLREVYIETKEVIKKVPSVS